MHLTTVPPRNAYVSSIGLAILFFHICPPLMPLGGRHTGVMLDVRQVGALALLAVWTGDICLNEISRPQHVSRDAGCRERKISDDAVRRGALRSGLGTRRRCGSGGRTGWRRCGRRVWWRPLSSALAATCGSCWSPASCLTSSSSMRSAICLAPAQSQVLRAPNSKSQVVGAPNELPARLHNGFHLGRLVRVTSSHTAVARRPCR